MLTLSEVPAGSLEYNLMDETLLRTMLLRGFFDVAHGSKELSGNY